MLLMGPSGPAGKLTLDRPDLFRERRTRLAKCFRRFVGQSPGEFARQARLERASRELHHTSKPLKLIASESGFAVRAHFTRAFKRVLGYVPAAARRTAD